MTSSVAASSRVSKASAIVSVASMLFGVIAVLLDRPRSRAREDSALFDGSTGGEEREGRFNDSRKEWADANC